MSLDQTRDLISEELWLLVPAEEEAYIHSRHRAKVEGTLSQSVFTYPRDISRKPTVKIPVFGERPLQASRRPCVSLTAVGEAEIVNRIRPGACGPPVE